MAPPKKRALPKPLPDGFILTDMEKKKWRLGKIIGEGGFGLIYLASQNVDRPVPADSKFVIKVEYLENGPLFSELKFYQRAAKKDTIQKWMRNKQLDFLGIPTYWGSGQAEYKDRGYRFMAMDRLGSDLQKICDADGGRFKPSTVLQLGKSLVDMLEYIHENEYVHSDIKAANLMQGHTDPHQVYLADYGLSYRYCPEGVHKEYKENPKKCHDGTIEYTSLDAHKGVAPSRRSDLQILGFCLLHWLCGRLPWDRLLQSPDRVQEAKTRFMLNLPESVQDVCSNAQGAGAVASFLLYVNSLQYQARPDYQLLRGILTCSTPGLDFGLPSRPGPGSSSEESQPKNKKTGGGRGVPQAEVMEEHEEEEQRTRPKQIPARYLRGPPIYKPQSTAEDMDVDEDEEEEQRRRPKRIPAGYLRGPPIGKPQSTAEAMEVDEDEEQRRRPKQIPARFLRGPPIYKPQAENKEVDEDEQTWDKPRQIPVRTRRRPQDPDTQAMMRTVERRPTWRREPTARFGFKNHFPREEDFWREHYNEAYTDFTHEECGPRDGNRRLLRWICAGVFLLIALATLRS